MGLLDLMRSGNLNLDDVGAHKLGQKGAMTILDLLFTKIDLLDWLLGPTMTGRTLVCLNLRQGIGPYGGVGP